MQCLLYRHVKGVPFPVDGSVKGLPALYLVLKNPCILNPEYLSTIKLFIY